MFRAFQNLCFLELFFNPFLFPFFTKGLHRRISLYGFQTSTIPPELSLKLWSLPFYCMISRLLLGRYILKFCLLVSDSESCLTGYISFLMSYQGLTNFHTQAQDKMLLALPLKHRDIYTGSIYIRSSRKMQCQHILSV